MIKVNAVGMSCPLPIIEAKKAINKLPPQGGTVQILLDNKIACENIGKMCTQKGYGYLPDYQDYKQYIVTITVGKGGTKVEQAVENKQEYSTQDLVVSIGSDKMGSGDDDLGRILIKSFVFSLVNMDIPPKTLLFFNSGVRLAIKDANTLDDLLKLQQKGTEILVCGTCVDFYNCKDQVAVGEITNMYNIVESLSKAKSVINI